MDINELTTILDMRYKPKDGNESESKGISHQTIQNDLMSTNYAKCTGSDCGGHLLKKSSPQKDFKSCPSCHTNSVPTEWDVCPTCGKNHDQDDWQDSDIDLGEE